MLSKTVFRSADDLDQYVDLQSVPARRFIHNHPFIARLRKAVGFDHVLISGLDIEGFRFGSAQSIHTDFPPAFVDIYHQERLHLTDSFVQHAKNHLEDVVVEGEVMAEGEPNERLAYLLDTFNIKNRTLFPIRRGTIMYGSVGFTRTTPFDRDEIDFLASIAPAAHTVITRPIMERFAASSLRLSSGEMICLKLASKGLTSGQIAEESGYQVDTVNTYIKNATRKVGAANRTQAIAEAIRRHLID